MLTKTEGGTTITYGYDGENRLVIADKTIGTTTTTTTFKYDPFGNRIEKTVNGVTTKYLYDGPNILYEYDGSNAIIARYTHNLATDDPLGLEKGGKLYAYHKDTLGSIRAITDGTQAIINSYSYDSFGNVTQTGTVNQPYAYTGREWDKETGLYYYRARYYDPMVGRFISKDPIGFAGGINLYAYVENNPINFTDPTGLYKDYPNKGGPGDVDNETIRKAKEILERNAENAREQARKLLEAEIDRLTKLLKDSCGKARTKILNNLGALRAFLKTGFRAMPIIVIIDPNTGMPVGMPGQGPNEL